MTIRSLSLAVAALMLCASASSMAADQQGWYMGAGVGAAKNKLSNSQFRNDTSVKDTDTAFKIYGGYQFNKNWAAELSYINFGKFRSSSTYEYVDISASSENLEVKSSAIALSGVGIMPLSENFSIFGKLGMAIKTTKATETMLRPGQTSTGQPAQGVYTSNNTSIIPLLGFGTEYRFSPVLAIRGEYEYAGKTTVWEQEGVKSDSSLMSVSLRYSF